MNKLTAYELKKMSNYIDHLNATVGLQSETIKDIKIKIKEYENREIKK